MFFYKKLKAVQYSILVTHYRSHIPNVPLNITYHTLKITCHTYNFHGCYQGLFFVSLWCQKGNPWLLYGRYSGVKKVLQGLQYCLYNIVKFQLTKIRRLKTFMKHKFSFCSIPDFCSSFYLQTSFLRSIASDCLGAKTLSKSGPAASAIDAL